VRTLCFLQNPLCKVKRSAGKRLSRQWRTQVVLLVYLSMATPYQIGFDVSEPQLWGVMFWFTLAMDMYFIVGKKHIN
jgi:hypothetical protein